MGTVGNAVARLFPAKAALEVGVEEYRKDPLLLVKTSETLISRLLSHWEMTGEPGNEKAVLDPARSYASSGSFGELVEGVSLQIQGCVSFPIPGRPGDPRGQSPQTGAWGETPSKTR